MTFDIRELTDADRAASTALSNEAFGFPTTPPPADAPARPTPGQRSWGAFDGEILAARTSRREYDSYFGGAVLPTCGIAGLTVAAEYRGRGLLTPLLGHALAYAREHGDVIATLYASAPGIYRRFGFELVCSSDLVEIPATAAAAVAPPADAGVTTRRAVAGDFDAVRDVYTRWAGAQNGPLTRTNVSFPDVDLTKEVDGVTLAVRGTEVLGYALWNRGTGEHSDRRLEVVDLIALSADAYRVLWRTVGSFASIVDTIRLSTSGADVARLFLPPIDWTTVHVNPYLLRVDDVAGAFSARSLEVDLTFAVAGDSLGVMDGTYELAGGQCVRVGDAGPVPAAAPVYTPGGLALAWSGAQSSANIRMAGGLRGGDAESDAAMDRALGGWQLHIRDAF